MPCPRLDHQGTACPRQAGTNQLPVFDHDHACRSLRAEACDDIEGTTNQNLADVREYDGSTSSVLGSERRETFVLQGKVGFLVKVWCLRRVLGGRRLRVHMWKGDLCDTVNPDLLRRRA